MTPIKSLWLPEDLIALIDAQVDGLTITSRQHAARLAITAWLQIRNVGK